MRVLFLPLITRGSALGTISRCLAVASELKAAGHDCFFVTNAEGERHVAAAGFPLIEGAVPDPPRPLGHGLYCLADVAVHLRLTEEAFIRRSLADERRAVEQFQPDVLVSEFKLTAPVTAATCRLPLVSTACTPADHRFVSPLAPPNALRPGAEATDGFNAVLAEAGMAPVEDVGELFFSRSQAKIAPTHPELEPMLVGEPGLTFVGSLLYDAWEMAPLPAGLTGRLPGKTPVYVYLGSGEIHPREYVPALEAAFDGTEFLAVAAVGDHPELVGLPPDTANTAWHRFLPAGSMLGAAKALLFHGGQNTAMASLIHGVPSLVFPGVDFERDFNADGLVGCGAGLKLPHADFQPERLLAACRELLRPEYAAAARAMGAKLRALGGPGAAAEAAVETKHAKGEP